MKLSGQDLDFSANANLNANDVSATGNVTLASSAGTISVAKLSGQDLDFSASGNLSANDVSATGNVTLASSAGAISVAKLSGQNLDFSANANLSADDVTATGDLQVTAARAISVTDRMTAQNIALTSADIDIAATGRIGVVGTTQSISLVNSDNRQPTHVGGAGTRNGYHIDAAELTRLFSANISIMASDVASDAAPSSAPDLLVEQFSMTAGASDSNFGGDAMLTIATSGSARVTGAINLTSLTQNSRFSLSANDRLEIILGGGSIQLTSSQLTEANPIPGGQLTLAADTVIIATEQALVDVINAPDVDAITDRLAENDGIIANNGAVIANGINIVASNGIYVQNSGANSGIDARRGLTFSREGVTLTPRSDSTVVVINAIQRTADSTVFGLDTIALIDTDSGSENGRGFDSLSSINGCLIFNTASCVVNNDFPIQDIIVTHTVNINISEDINISENSSDDGNDSDENEDNSANNSETETGQSPLILYAVDSPLVEPLLDDPTTGIGNEDMWVPSQSPSQSPSQ